jgi:hypothetical protein
MDDELKRVINAFARQQQALLQQQKVSLQLQIHTEIRALLEDIRRRTPDNPCLAGAKLYSQCDEDGIIAEIFRRIGGGTGGAFLEIGCGNGIENNTHALLLAGWRGTWVDGDPKNIERIRANLPQSAALAVVQQLVDTQNVAQLPLKDLDFLSLDIDGNDLHVLRAILETARPRVICVEYNAKFPPPQVISVAYNPGHAWAGDDYHGASLQAFVDAATGYRLVACNVAGTNAFFVREDCVKKKFKPYTAAELYQPPRFNLVWQIAGHPPSFKFLANALRGGG